MEVVLQLLRLINIPLRMSGSVDNYYQGEKFNNRLALVLFIVCIKN